MDPVWRSENEEQVAPSSVPSFTGVFVSQRGGGRRKEEDGEGDEEEEGEKEDDKEERGKEDEERRRSVQSSSVFLGRKQQTLRMVGGGLGQGWKDKFTEPCGLLAYQAFH